jgi:hypothetical protein
MSGPLATVPSDDHGGVFVTSRWRLPVLLVLAAALVLGGTMLLLRGGGEPQVAATAQAEAETEVQDPADEPEDPASTTEEEAQPVPEVTYEVYLARDPFEPVREPPTTADPEDETIAIGPDPDDPDATVDPDDPDATVDPDDPDAPAAPGDPGTPPESGCRGGEDEMVCDGRVITLEDIVARDGRSAAVVQVDTTLYEVGEGQDFAETFRMVEIRPGERRVRVMYGDESFTLRQGDRTLK